MVHRGPDDAGSFLYIDGDLHVGLGHRRLSILDLSERGRQPMATSDGNLVIAFNGEIFNYKELAKDLAETRGCRFVSGTDTEVLLLAVLEWGLEETLERVRGMYAFVLFDRQKQNVTLVRDPLGVKPLYYRLSPSGIVFASEIKAILAAPDAEATINLAALSHYLTFSNVPPPDTLFLGVKKLESGSWLRLDGDGVETRGRYWDPARFNTSTTGITEEDCVAELRRLLRQSVVRRMVSDVPFGAFLSGGLDSSLNVALMAEVLDRPVTTFSIAVESDPMAELSFARQIAREFHTDHHEVTIGDEEFLALLPKLAYLQDEPLADPVCVPLYYLSQCARESGTTVIQVGEGSDEIFAGYPLYHRFASWENGIYALFMRLPHGLKRMVSGFSRPVASAALSDALARAAEDEPLFLGNAVAFWDREKQHLVADGEADLPRSSAYIQHLASDLARHDGLERIVRIELTNRLPELLLMRVDKMSMAHSIETRVPYLDEDVVEFVLKMPAEIKWKDGEPKYILKKAAAGLVPQSVINRTKRGFCGSATDMLSDRVIDRCSEIIHGCGLMHDHFSMDFIDALFAAQKAKKRFNNFKIWNLTNLAVWYETWFAGNACKR